MDLNKKIPPNEPLISKYLHEMGCRKGIPIGGNFELTPRCNFNCKMCYIHDSKVKKEDELTADRWIGLAEKAKSAGTVFLLITGGEPLIRDDFTYIFHHLKDMGMFVSINTNGSLIDKELLEFFKKDPPFRFNISLYGASDETYERLCGNASYEKVISNIKALREAGIDVRLNASITPYNAQDTDKLYELAKDAGVFIKTTSYMYPPVRLTDKPGESNVRFSATEAAKYTLLCREKLSTPEQILKSLKDGETEDCSVNEGEGIRCRAGRSSFWLTWDGRMIPCGMMNIQGVSAVEEGFDVAWEKTKAFAKTVRQPRECTACKYRAICPACAAACLAETGAFDTKPQYLCDYTNAVCTEAVKRYKK